MFFKEEGLESSKWEEIALRVTWAAVCFGKQFLDRVKKKSMLNPESESLKHPELNTIWSQS